MSIKNSLDANKIIKRVKECLQIKRDVELAILLDVKQNTISSWKKRNNIDLNKIISICEPTGISIDYLLYGKCEKCKLSNQIEQADHDPTTKIIEMLESMTSDQKRDVLKYAEKEKFIEELIQSRKTA